MSIISYVATDLFIIRVIKYLSTNPDNKWVNSYEFTAVADGDVGDMITLANTVVAFEALLHTELVTFDHVTASTWVDDHVPYDPTSFLSIPLTQVGTRSDVPNEVEALGMAWRVNRVPVSGRRGNLFYRGALFENEVSAPAGIPILSVPGDLATILNNAVSTSGLEDYIGSGSTALALSMVDATGGVVRLVNSLVSSGVSLIKQDHQWFNRTSP